MSDNLKPKKRLTIIIKTMQMHKTKEKKLLTINDLYQ